MRARSAPESFSSPATSSKARDSSATDASSAVAMPWTRWSAGRPRRFRASSIDGRSSRTSEAACTSSTATATGIAAARGARARSAAASVAIGRSLLRARERHRTSPARDPRRARPAAEDSARAPRRAKAGPSPRTGRRRRPARRGPSGGAALALEARESLRLRLVHVEDGDELGDRQHVVDLRRQVQELQLSALVRHGGVAADELADPRRIDGRDVVHVDEDVLLARVDQLVDRLAELHVSRTNGDLALELDDLHPADFADVRLHAGFSSLFSIAPRFFFKTISMPPSGCLRKRTSSMNVRM